MLTYMMLHSDVNSTVSANNLDIDNNLLQEIKQHQHSDPDLHDIILYLHDGRLPESQQRSRDILMKHSD